MPLEKEGLRRTWLMQSHIIHLLIKMLLAHNTPQSFSSRCHLPGLIWHSLWRYRTESPELKQNRRRNVPTFLLFFLRCIWHSAASKMRTCLKNQNIWGLSLQPFYFDKLSSLVSVNPNSTSTHQWFIFSLHQVQVYLSVLDNIWGIGESLAQQGSWPQKINIICTDEGTLHP